MSDVAATFRSLSSSAAWRAWSLFAGIAFPVATLILGRQGIADDDCIGVRAWKSGRLDHYVVLLLSPGSTRPLYPLIVIAMLVLASVCVSPTLLDRRFIRLGLGSGVALTSYFSLVEAIGDPGLAPACIVAAGAPPLIVMAYRRFGLVSVKRLLIGLLVVITIASCLFGVLVVIGISLFSFVTSAAPLAISAYAVPWWAARRSEASAVATVARVSWAGIHAAAWAVSYAEMLNKYSQLPIAPPMGMCCYVVSAAANGHRAFVGAVDVTTPSGTIRVNAQLQRLKFAELALQSWSPRLHCALRVVYDRIGPRLARRIRHPLLADLAYLGLKPFEWLAVLILSAV